MIAALLAEVGGPTDAARAATITGHDPVLPCRFPVGECAAVALAGCASMAAHLWRERTGEEQAVHVDVARAAASLISFSFQRVEPGTETPAAPSNADRLIARPLVALY